jgi:hypothetical protein
MLDDSHEATNIGGRSDPPPPCHGCQNPDGKPVNVPAGPSLHLNDYQPFYCSACWQDWAKEYHRKSNRRRARRAWERLVKF